MRQKQEDLISVIVPVYNVEQYLAQCLESILGSTYRNLEVICVDDASTDGSPEILKQYAEKDPRIRMIRCELNGGQAAARNKGLDIANGMYLAFADSDDYVSDTFFEKLYKQCLRDKSDVCACGFLETDEVTGRQKAEILRAEKTPLNEKEWWDLYRHKHTVFMNCVCNKLYRAECFKDQRFVQGIIYEDTNLQHYLLQGKTISVIDEPLYYYRRRLGSTTTSSYSEKSFSRVQSLIDRAKYFAEKKWNRAKVATLQDATKFLYHAVYDSNMDRKRAKEQGKTYSDEIRALMNIRDWFSIRQKGQCIMILYCPEVYHRIRTSGRR